MKDLVDLTMSEWRRTPFVYGENDCLLGLAIYVSKSDNPANSLDAIKQFQYSYDTEDGAQALVDAAGGPEYLLDLIGLPRIPPEEAERGDIVIITTPKGQTIGALCTGSGTVVRTMYSTYEMSKRLVPITHAWKV